MYYSIIIPVYNRPDEVDELLESISRQTYKNLEVIIVEDGSTVSCKSIVDKYKDVLPVLYYYKPNSGPGQTRNYGAEKCKGDYLIFLDSDCIVPENYLMSVENELQSDKADFFGGPDKAHDSFTKIQKAINYSMTSLFTTGGIRGKKKGMDKFYPRSFNMGIAKAVFNEVGGFSEMRFGEDIDLSIRIINKGFKSRLFPDSWVYHKRRTDLKKFFKQIFNSGIARVNLYKLHPKSLKTVHLLPALFTSGLLFLPFLFPVYLFYSLLIFIDSFLKTKNVTVALLSIITSFVQLTAYGSGFIYAIWTVILFKQNKKAAFSDTFYD